ncbi:restriction endonuclease subunit S [Pseudoalteromonas sp. CnMc7-15]|uniref:restriction endonuclease subunit S n=1 Tax=unclassified Pseudoalteromonas TaxID=194690 RepID=UPI001EF71E22|nr:restriction endonuclease subunit S [Pseudoalteromonas sp. CnMc7-15]MCG7565464.1 restriction endonuclease subunit S [Pseudoalteromonas sp. CnMc7-15]
MTLTQWKSKSLGYILEKIVGGGTPSKANPQYWDGDIPWASVKDLSSTKLDDTADKISEEGLKNSSSNLIPAETIVIPTRMALGKVAITTQAMAINQDLKALFPSKEVCKSYLFQWLIFHAEQVASLGTGSTVKGIRLEQLKKIPFSYPTLKEEQQKIAEVLSTVDKKIDLIDQKIAETEKLKTGLMQKLFSEGVGVQDENGNWQPHTEFQDSPFGKVPKCWLKVSLENIASVERGKFSARPRNDPKYFGGNIPFVQTGDVVNAQLYVESYSQTLNELGLTVSKTFPPETILITIAANIGDVAITQFPLACPDSLVGIQAKKDICDSLWLFFFMQTQKSELDSKATKSAQKNINLQVLKPLTVFLPPLEEQEFIAEILLASEQKIALLKQQKAETQQLKKGLMQKLLTGEWRVPVEKTEAA